MTTGQSDAQFSAKLRETSPTEVRKRQDALWMCSEREGRGELWSWGKSEDRNWINGLEIVAGRASWTNIYI